METTSKITACVFKSSWTPPNGGVLHIHELIMENGESGTVYTKEQNPNELSVGQTITYTKNAKGKITIVKKESEKPNTPKRQFEATGIAFGYVKDIICARISSGEKIKDPWKELSDNGKRIARYMNAVHNKLKDENNTLEEDETE